MCTGVLPACKPVYQRPEQVLDFLELELQVASNCLVGAGN